MPERQQTFGEMRDGYFKTLGALRDAHTRRRAIEASFADPAVDQIAAGDDMIAVRRSIAGYRRDLDALPSAIDTTRPDIRADLLSLLRTHYQRTAEQESIVTQRTGTPDEIAVASSRLGFLNSLLAADPFLVRAQQVAQEEGSDFDITAGAALPESLGSQEGEEDRLKHCQKEVFPERLVALDAYLAAREADTPESMRAFGRALGQVKHTVEGEAEPIPFTNISNANWALTHNAVRMLDERHYWRNKGHFLKPGEKPEDHPKKWLPVNEEEHRVWEAIVAFAEPYVREERAKRNGKRKPEDPITGIEVERFFARDLNAWYKAHSAEVLAGFNEGRPAGTRRPAGKVGRVADLLPGMNGATPEMQPVDPHLTNEEAFALVGMLFNVSNTAIFFPGQAEPQMTFTLESETVKAARAYAKAFNAQRKAQGLVDTHGFVIPLSSSQIMEHRRAVVDKLRVLLTESGVIDTQAIDLPSQEDMTLTPTELVQSLLIALAKLNDEFAGYLPTFLEQMQVTHDVSVRPQLQSSGTYDAFDHSIQMADMTRWAAPAKMAEIVEQRRRQSGSHGTSTSA